MGIGRRERGRKWGARKLLFPLFLSLSAALLLGLVAVSPEASDSRPERSPGDPGAGLAPWAPLDRPEDALRKIQGIVEDKNPRERLPALQGIYGDDSDRSLSARARGVAAFAAAMLMLDNRRGPEAVELLGSADLSATELQGYALFFVARELETTSPDRALDALAELESGHPDFLRLDEARIEMARLLDKRGDRDGAIAVLQRASESQHDAVRGEVLDDLGSLFSDAKRYDEAVLALETLYYELPRHPRAAGAAIRLNALRRKLPPVEPLRLYTLGVHRAELLMAEDRYSDAYQTLAPLLTRYASVADDDAVRLKMGICLYRRRQFTAASAQLKQVRRNDLAPEALYYLAEISRRVRQRDSYMARSRDLLERFPKSPWSEEMLLSLARYYEDREEHHTALSYYRRMAEEFPAGKYFLDAKWYLLWNDYRSGRVEEAAYGWEEAARARPGSDDVSKFLYWAGRAFQDAGRFDRAEPLYRQVLLGYQNTYYGRRSLEHLSEVQGQRASLAAIEAARKGIDLSDALAVQRVDLQERILQLYAAGLEKEALEEAASAVRGLRDDAAFLTIAAWIHADRSRNIDAFRTLRDAFPFHISATGDLLPRPIWELIYPLRYWEHVEHYSAERGLDPYLVSGLIRQESTFNPRVRSHAGARGLMQIIPSTGRILARQERRRYDAAELYNPEINIRYGTRYLQEVLASFGGRVDYALASYNAGPHRVKRWTGMDLTIPSEVFIEEIPFDETRDYVKLVLRNEMLYRRLYGSGQAQTAAE